MHRAAAGVGVEVVLRPLGELVQHTGVVDDERRLDLVEHDGALPWREARVERHRHDTAARRRQHEVDGRRRAGGQQRDAVAVRQAGDAQRAGHAALS